MSLNIELTSCLINSVAEPKLFIFVSGSIFVYNFGSSSCKILPLKIVLEQQYHKKYVSIEVFLHPSILQTDCSKYLFKRSFRLHRFRAPPHCENVLFFKRFFLGGIFDFRHVVNIIYIAGPAEGPEEEALGARQACHSC